MAMKEVEQTQNIGLERAIALLHAIRDPSIANYLSEEDQKKVQNYGARHHTSLTNSDAQWMASKISATIAVEPPRTQKVQMEDGVNPHAK